MYHKKFVDASMQRIITYELLIPEKSCKKFSGIKYEKFVVFFQMICFYNGISHANSMITVPIQYKNWYFLEEGKPHKVYFVFIFKYVKWLYLAT